MNSVLRPLVSIITPIHNEQEYLAECIESVLAQTYQNWDYTIVDNRSTDRSLEIARRYAAKESRIRIVENQQFLRVISNHNAALGQISPKSKYCKIVFGDDWIFPECLDRMVALAEEHPSVGIVGAYSLQGERVMWAGLQYPGRLVPGKEICRRFFLDGVQVFGAATSLLYRADLVRSHDPFYNEANFHADLETSLALLKVCDFGFVHQVLTFQRVRPGSLSTIASEINAYAPGKLQALVTHGRDFLTPEEFRACLNQTLSDYYAALAGGLVRGRDKRFWEYHKRKLADAGFGFSRTRLARVILAKVCRAILNPKHGIEKAWQIASEAGRPSVHAKETR